MSEPEAPPVNQTECEAVGGTWNEETKTCKMPEKNPSVPGGTDMASLLRENEMLKARVTLREKQLKQAIGIANRANDERKAKDEAEKQSLIQSIQIDGKFSKDELEKKSLDELHTIRFTLDRSIEKTFANVAAEIDEAKRKRQPHLTAGAWDSEKKQWVGGT
jgi:hypothetical protein